MLLGTSEGIADHNAISLQPLQDEVHPGCLFWLWFAFGLPAFAAVLVIPWLMRRRRS